MAVACVTHVVRLLPQQVLTDQALHRGFFSFADQGFAHCSFHGSDAARTNEQLQKGCVRGEGQAGVQRVQESQ